MFGKKTFLGEEAIIVASAGSSTQFYKTSERAIAVNDKWKKSELLFSVPEFYSDSIINFYIWLPSGDSVWIDNFSIERFSVGNK